MDTAVIEPRSKSNTRFLPKSRNAGDINVDANFENIVKRRLFEEGLVETDLEASKAAAAVKDFARSKGLSLSVLGVDALLEEYEDMVFGRIMDECMNEPGFVSREEIMKLLDE